MGQQVAVIGLGAAGSMAAIAAAESGAEVVAWEQNEKLGKKIYLTGKGRCNVTNAAAGADFFAGIARHPKFLYSAFSQFSNQDLMRWLESEGLALKVERGQRVFPVSDKASDVIRTLERALVDRGVRLYKQHRIEAVWKEGERFFLRSQGVVNSYDALILACGGKSYPSTGSDGNGYELARSFGHTIQPCSPSLVSFLLEEDLSPAVGLSLRNVALTARLGKSHWREFGDLLITQRGISGPTVLRLSAELSGRDLSGLQLSLDWKPALSPDALRKRLLSEREKGSNRAIRRVYESLLPRSAVGLFEARLGNADGKLHQWTRQAQENLISLLKDFPLRFQSLGGFHEAVVTRGGVSLSEIRPQTMGSRLVAGLYFAGEMLDVDGYTGGYNLQIAFSTGHAAGLGAARGERESK